MYISLSTKSRDQALDVTSAINQVLAQQNWQQGQCHLFVPHTTAAITVNEGFDPCVMADVLTSLNKLITWKDNYTHLEGNSAAHLKSILVGVSLSLPIKAGRLDLGQWQKVFFLEFDGPRRRQFKITFSN